MEITYEKLFKLMKSRKISKTALIKGAELLKSDMIFLERNLPLDIPTLLRICDFLKCSLVDITDYEESKKGTKIYVSI